MKLPPRKWIKAALLAAVCAVLVAGVAAPFLSADRFGNRIREALERSLRRQVEIGEVHFNLFTGPGFTVSDVVIREDPAFGIEPFAYVDSMEAAVKLSSLLRGRLEFSSLVLDVDSLNLVKNEAGYWNMQPLLEETVSGNGVAGAMPEISVRSARVNFKFGDVKSAFYFTNSDVDIRRASADGTSFRLTFAGEPGRTDRPEQGFGRLSGSGSWSHLEGKETTLSLNLRLEKSAISEVMTLIYGRDVGLHGHVGSRASLKGPVSNLEITGRLEMEDIHRWDLLPLRGEVWPLDYRGKLDLRGQRIEVETADADSILAVRLEASEFLRDPIWTASARLKGVPLASLLEVARHTGANLPPDLLLDGKLEGVLGFSPQAGIQGGVTLNDAMVQIPGSTPLRSGRAELRLSGSRVDLSPAVVRMDDQQTATVEGRVAMDTGEVDLRLSTSSLAVEELQSGSGRLLGAALVPLLEQCDGGTWRGAVRYRREAATAGEWSGDFQIRDSKLALPGFNHSLKIQSGAVALRGSRLTVSKLRAEIGQMQVEGEYRYDPKLARPHHLRLSLDDVDAAAVEQLLMPALQRRAGFLARTLRLRPAPAPEWLKSRHVDGIVQINRLTVGQAQFERVRARLLWDGVHAELANVQARLEDGLATGWMSADMSAVVPRYRIGLRLENVRWRGGRIDAETNLETSGTGADLLLNLRSDGSWNGRSLTIGPDTEFHSVSGFFDLAAHKGMPRLRLTELQIAMGQETFLGEGATQADGRLLIDLSSGNRQMRLAGTLYPLEFELLTARDAAP